MSWQMVFCCGSKTSFAGEKTAARKPASSRCGADLPAEVRASSRCVRPWRAASCHSRPISPSSVRPC
eukprot:412132-Prymnesium_polylepis.1